MKGIGERVPFPQPVRAATREGVGWAAADLDKWVVAGGLDWALIGKRKFGDQREGSFMSEVVEAYESARKLIDDANAAYNKTVAGFRGTIKNDLASIASSAEKVQAEVGKMQRAYQAAVETLTSPSMASAIENAERLANALKAISELQSHSITFAVLDKKSA